jgi:DNA-directed RNA polymerase specialized sigma24 family protein
VTDRPPIAYGHIVDQSTRRRRARQRSSDKSLEDAENVPEPDELAQEIADDLQAALEQFVSIAAALKDSG